jgi:hypothetical protein
MRIYSRLAAIFFAVMFWTGSVSTFAGEADTNDGNYLLSACEIFVAADSGRYPSNVHDVYKSGYCSGLMHGAVHGR